MDESVKIPSQSSSYTRYWLATFWVASLLLVGFLSYGYGKGAVNNQPKVDEKVLSAESTPQATMKDPAANTESTATVPEQSFPTTAATSTAASETSTCSKTGFAQKWEYLTPYVLKENESLQSIATDQLKDGSRVNELLQLNGVGPLVVGATIYLPPPSITKSSGNIRQLYGKLVDKNDTSWHVSFTNDKNGQGILIPSYLFQTVQNASSVAIGSCVSVLLDDGYKVYTLSLQ